MLKMEKPTNPYRYYIVGSQIAMIVACAIFMGYQLDEYFKIKEYYFTIFLALISIIYALVNLVRQIKK
tara:strand:+ start:144 stop:347 length:204 start_codon:yes stop_codon:yes gene_type:complete